MKGFIVGLAVGVGLGVLFAPGLGAQDVSSTGEASAEKSDEHRAGEVVQRKTSLAEEARQEQQYPGQPNRRQIVVQEPGNNPKGNLL